MGSVTPAQEERVNIAAVSYATVRESATAHLLAKSGLAILFSYVFLANAWLGDDAYITFRVVWNLVHGYGLTFNVDERVQAFTHPLWAFAIAGAYMATREFFFTVTFLCWACCLAAGGVLVQWGRRPAVYALLIAWLLTSKALVDYTASGLENPLSYLLLALFYSRYLNRPAAEPPSVPELRTLALLASLGFLNRPDAILLYAVPLVHVAATGVAARRGAALLSVAVGLAPAVAWVVFATLYYGFPLPNTYYAKVANGIPRSLMLTQGFAYVLNSIRHDPLTLATVVLAGILSWRGTTAARCATASVALYVAYTVWVGGDFMSGRFFSMPFLVAAMVVVPELATLAAPVVAVALVLYNIVVPLVPIKTTASYDGAWPWRSQNGIKDERGHYHQGTNVLFFSPFRELPDFVFLREGRSFRESPKKATVHGSIGMFGLYAGPDKYVIDRNALSDPLLARLPVSPRLYFEFYAGHYFRDLPEGYLESVETGHNRLTDPALREYYERLRNVIRGSIFRLDRFRDVWALNLGRYRDLHKQFEKRRPIALSIRADNERFLTHVGVRDPVAGTLRTTGPAGFLQYGPRIPIKPGAYRARWIGTAPAATGAKIGFVDVTTDGTTSLQRAPLAPRGAGGREVLAQIDFTLAEPAGKLEYRLWIDENISLTLERVELYSAVAIPAGP
jgi:arabinofuranosyltransferase